MVVSSYISPKAVKGRPSGIQGRGLVAVAPIAKDEIVAIKGGHLVDTRTLDALPERLRNTDIQITDDYHCRRLHPYHWSRHPGSDISLPWSELLEAQIGRASCRERV